MSWEDEIEVFAVIDRIEDGQDSTTRVANCATVSIVALSCHRAHTAALTDMLYALPQHHLMEDFATFHADKAVIHLRLAVWLQWLHILVPIVVAVEGWAGHRACWHGGWRCRRRPL